MLGSDKSEAESVEDIKLEKPWCANIKAFPKMIGFGDLQRELLDIQNTKQTPRLQGQKSPIGKDRCLPWKIAWKDQGNDWFS
jgi:hypothetical protein